MKLGKRPLLALPVNNAVSWAAAVQCYPAHSWKKRTVRSLIGGTFWSGLADIIWAKHSSPVEAIPAEELESWNEQILRGLGDTRLRPVFVWPANPTRGRVYVHWQNPEGHTVAFTKLALDSGNSALIENERITLEQLAKLQLQKSRIPRVLLGGRLRQHSYLVIEAAPRRARVTDWQKDSPIDKQVGEFAGATVRKERDRLEKLPWWNPLMQFLEHDATMLQTIRNIAEEGVNVCRVHGDLNRTNVLRDGKDVWLLDWECSSEAGPCLTDHVCMAVDRIWAVTQQDPRKGLDVFVGQNWDNKEKTHREEVLLALAFLSMCAFPPAKRLFERWGTVETANRSV